MNGQAATRLTCFAVLSAIEVDVRRLIRASASGMRVALMPEDVRAKAAARWEDDHKEPFPITSADDAELLGYCDFADLAKLLRRHSGALAHVERTAAVGLATRLEELTPARNRVCHTRPLEAGDWADFHDLAGELLERHAAVDWSELSGVVATLERNPAFVLSLQIPDYWRPRISRVSSNLPAPDFDDTGFLGREADRKAVAKCLVAPHPVVTIVGEGGVGKTALALQCAYDVLLSSDDTPGPPRFEAIVWTTLKSKVLTPEGARDIERTIGSTLGLAQVLAGALGMPDVAGVDELQVLIDEILAYLTDFRVLLIIDNFESLTDEAKMQLRPLLAAVPTGSKVLITSRVGLGELEYRYPIDGLDGGTAAELARKFARTLNLRSISELPEPAIRRYCELLYRNPLLVRWFVSSVHAGAAPEKLLNREGSPFRAVIDYCFENLFERLTALEREIVHILSSARRPLSHAELFYLTRDRGRDDVEWALNVLHRSSIVTREDDRTTGPESAGGLTFRLSDIAGTYIDRSAPPPPDLFATVQNDLRRLFVMAASDARELVFQKYKINAIRHSNRDERIAAYYLRNALEQSHAGDLAEARSLIEQAKELTPGFSEVHRISGVVEQQHGDPYKADLEYRTAITMDKRSAPAKYSYAQFLMKKGVEDFEGALKQLSDALSLDPGDDTLETSRAWALTLLGRYREATEAYEVRVLPALRSGLWKKSVRTQAASCYLRWSVQDRVAGDSASFKLHLQRALAILEQSFSEGHGTYDDQMRDLFVEIVDEALRFALTGGDTEYAEEVARRLVEQVSRYARRAIRLSTIAQAARTFPRSAHVQRLSALLQQRGISSEPARSAYAPGTRLSGRVDSASPDKGYGFILDSSGIRWFFHWSAVTDRATWVSLGQGTEVDFTVGANTVGPCAVDIARRVLAPAS